MNHFIVFYAGLVYGEFSLTTKPPLYEFPEGCYLYYPKCIYGKHWYLKDMTPVLLQDVPKELLLNVLLLT